LDQLSRGFIQNSSLTKSRVNRFQDQTAWLNVMILQKISSINIYFKFKRKIIQSIVLKQGWIYKYILYWIW